MIEKILEAFDNLGFKLEKGKNAGYSFTYEGMNLLLLYNDDDTSFLNIANPAVYEAKEENALKVCALMEKINSTLKYVKAYLVGNNVWTFYERELFGDENLSFVISRMILHLEAARQFARKSIAEIESTMTNDSSDEEAEDAAEETATEESKDDNNN